MFVFTLLPCFVNNQKLSYGKGECLLLTFLRPHFLSCFGDNMNAILLHRSWILFRDSNFCLIGFSLSTTTNATTATTITCLNIITVFGYNPTPPTMTVMCGLSVVVQVFKTGCWCPMHLVTVKEKLIVLCC
jgi:hypothetical protein